MISEEVKAIDKVIRKSKDIQLIKWLEELKESRNIISHQQSEIERLRSIIKDLVGG